MERRALIAGCATGTLGVLVFALLPLMLGAFADALAIDDAALGWLGSAYVAGYTLITAAAFLWIDRIPWRWVFGIGAVLMAGGFALTAMNPGYANALAGLGAGGAGAGLLYALSVAIISRLADVDRAFAIKMVPEQALPALLLFVLPVAVVARFGLVGLLTTVSVIALLGLTLLPLIVQGKARTTANPRSSGGITLVLAALLGLLMFFGGIAGVWAFAERLLVEADIDKATAGQMLAIGVVASAIGPLLVAFIGDRFGRIAPLLVALAVVIAALLALARQPSALGFTVLMFAFPAAWYAGMAYQMGIIADADHSGRYSVLIAAALGVGATIGPAAYGEIKAAFDTLAANAAACAVAAAGTALSAWVVTQLPARRSDKQVLHLHANTTDEGR